MTGDLYLNVKPFIRGVAFGIGGGEGWLTPPSTITALAPGDYQLVLGDDRRVDIHISRTDFVAGQGVLARFRVLRGDLHG